ncbi:hypothetical protein J7M07_04395, partial [bacterium]|nr:hypothetical protein [bacterium]
MDAPHDYDVERVVIGIVIMYPSESIKQVLSGGGDELFYDPVCRSCFKVAEELYEHGEPIDVLTISDRLKNKKYNGVHWEREVLAIVEDVASDAHLPHYIDILKDKAALRRLILYSNAILAHCEKGDIEPVNLIEKCRHHLHDIEEFHSSRKKSLAEEIRDWVLSSPDVFMSADIIREFDLRTRTDKKNCYKVLERLVKEGLIERCGDRRGKYRVVDDAADTIDFLNASDETMDIRYPFEIEKYVLTHPGNIIVVAGEPNAGKTAFLLNIVRMNMENHDIWYFNSEMGAAELKKRLMNFDIPLKDWRFKARERGSNFHDVIQPNAVNIIDFLEIYDNFYLIGQDIKMIHDKLDKGIAIIAIQKNRGTDFGLGGQRALEKPRLYLTMGDSKIKIVKAKNWRLSDVNPNNLEVGF